MAFSATSIWHGWSTGATDFGGGFDPASSNFLTDLTTDAATGNTASPVVSSASYNFVAGDVGAWLFVQSGTNWTPGWYQIASVASNKATLTASAGSGVLYGTDATLRNYRRPNGVTTAAGVATVGTPTGGVFSVDYSQQTSAKFTYTDMVIGGVDTTQFTSVANPVTPVMVGNIINVTSGTGFTVQRVQVTNFTLAGLIATCDKSLGTAASTGGNGKLGGAIGSTSVITALTQSLVAGNHVYLKGTFTLTATTTVTASAKGDLTNGRITVEGFTTVPGQRDGRVSITTATNSTVLLTFNDNDYFHLIHLSLSNSAATKGNGINFATAGSTPFYIEDCVIDGCSTGVSGAVGSVSHYYVGVEIKNCNGTAGVTNTAGASQNWYFYGCDIHDNTGPGVRLTTSTSVVFAFRTIFDTNSDGVIHTGATSTYEFDFQHCTFVDNSSDGIEITATSGTVTTTLMNNVFYGNGGYGVNSGETNVEMVIRVNCFNAYGSNTSGARNNLVAGRSDVTLTADPFTNKASRNFAPNNTAGGGALLRAAAFPGAFQNGTTTSYADIGAVQHQDAPPAASPSNPVFIGAGPLCTPVVVY